MENTSSRRNFMKKMGYTGAAVTASSVAGPLLLGGSSAFAASGESTQEIVNYALTAEQLATTFYYTGVKSNLGDVTNSGNKPYLQAALAEENYHVQLFVKSGGKSLAGSNPKFYFPKGTFSNSQTFLTVLDALETAFIEAYLAAIYQFSMNGRNDLAALAGEILGVESEHRVLGRQIKGENVPNNYLLEKAPPKGSTVAQVGKALVPFLSKSSKNPDGPYALPTNSQITQAVGGVSVMDPNNGNVKGGTSPVTGLPTERIVVEGAGLVALGAGALAWARRKTKGNA